MTNTPDALKGGSHGANLIGAPPTGGVTWEQIKADDATGKMSVVPNWLSVNTDLQILSPESSAAGRPLQVVGTRDSHWVGCGTLPGETDRTYAAILLPVTGS
jgi:hypothetical protein